MRRRAAGLLVLAGAAGCGPATEPKPEPTKFGAPVLGVPMAELFYGAYLDQRGRDYSCGIKYYGGHRGTDILLRSFRAQDSGVTVVAAAAGTVQALHDGEPDRNTANDTSRPWNFVSVSHADGLTSYYGHLRAGSLKVAVGQTVAPGTPLALVGSSGNSNWPHLHFEVRLGSTVYDPWEGPCQPARSLWQSQLPYQDQFKLLDTGVLDRPHHGLADLLERPPDAEPVTGSQGVVTVWAELYNIRAAPLRAEFYAPDGSPAGVAEYPSFSTFSATYVALSLPVTPGLEPGPYTMVLLARPVAGGDLAEIARRTFTLASVVPRPTVRAGPPARLTIELFSPGGDGPQRP